MDWSKAKTILIIAFLLTDLFLIATYGLQGHKTGELSNNQTLIAVLERKNIFIAAEIPEEHRDMPVLYVQHEAHDQNRMQALLQTGYSIVNKEQTEGAYQKTAETFLKDAGLMQETTVFDKIERSDKTVAVFFRNQIKGIPIEESSISCTFEDGLITAVEYNWLRAKGFNNKKQSTISAADALLTLMEDHGEGEKMVIEGIQMVYWLEEGNIDVTAVTDTAIPAWKITYNGDQEKYINAYEQ